MSLIHRHDLVFLITATDHACPYPDRVTEITVNRAPDHFIFQDRIVRSLPGTWGQLHRPRRLLLTCNIGGGYGVEVCEFRLLGHIPVSA
jgi:hypothetical protein